MFTIDNQETKHWKEDLNSGCSNICGDNFLTIPDLPCSKDETLLIGQMFTDEY